MLINYTIRNIINEDLQQALTLLPALAEFHVPHYRNPDHLWQEDAKLLKRCVSGDAPNTNALVAVDPDSNVHGIAIFTMLKELLSGEPSAHLEALTVYDKCRKQGIGKALINATEATAKSNGAKSLTLHVFSQNTRARNLYTASDFQEELLRCYKPL